MIWVIKMLQQNVVLDLLRANMPTLRGLGIRSLSIFGSVARNQAGPESDVDLLVEMDPPYTFDRYIQAKFFLEDLLGCPVDLVMPDALKPRARNSIFQEAIRVA